MKARNQAHRVSVAVDLSQALTGMVDSSRSHIYTMAWRNQAQECLTAMVDVFSFLRSRSDKHITSTFIRDVLWQLAVLETMVWDEVELWDQHARPAGHFTRSYQDRWDEVIGPLKRFVLSLPDYCESRRGRQWPETSDVYMFVVRQMASFCCSPSADSGRSVLLLQPLPEAEMVNRILILDRGVEHDVTGDRREAVSCK